LVGLGSHREGVPIGVLGKVGIALDDGHLDINARQKLSN